MPTNPPDILRCSFCEEEIQGEVGAMVCNRRGVTLNLCESCHDEYFRVCYSCSDGIDIENDDNIYCENRNEYFCGNCLESHDGCDCDEEAQVPVFSVPPFEAGKLITSPRLFGIEVECNDRSEELRVDRAVFEKGGDGSLGDYGVEIRTKYPISGKFGEERVLDLGRALAQANCDVDEKCGFHVHLDAQDYMSDDLPSFTSLKRLWAFYLAFEDVLMSFLPKSRRTNNFCKGMKTVFHYNEILMVSSRVDLEKLWYRLTSKLAVQQAKAEYHHGSRYLGINFHSFFREGHLEIRYHSGTTNPVKMLRWVALHQSIMDKVRNGQMSDSLVQQANSLVTLTEKVKLFYKVLNLEADQQRYLEDRVKKFNPSVVQEEALVTL